ncbi:MAG: HAD hydrolase-like protein [Bacteroides sp.]|nr:HAD hydrolase-like protein [Prevotella sp.]MCM1406848.1 HAD hydrolase-like protein [Treponema brennaborense]MCM1470823.1 HAD hydrolase-like protein [Bacteroides sp.]
MKDYIFFDLDGTLTDSQTGIINALRSALGCFDMHKSDAELRMFIGPPLKETFRKTLSLSDAETETALERFHAYYDTKGLFENRVYDGIVPLLANLRKNGTHLAVATSKPEITAKRILAHFDLAEYFDCICGSGFDESNGSKAEVIAAAMRRCALCEKDVSRIIMVGDRNNDILGAHKNGIEAAAVLYGYGSEKEFKQAGADYIAETPAALEIFLQSITRCSP